METTRFVETSDAHLATTVQGPADGRAVVLLHAGVADRRGWESCVDALAAQHRVVAYDRRGFGASATGPASFSHVEDLFAVLSACEIDRAVLVGSSQGGRVALEACLAAPARVAGLVLLAPAVTGGPVPDDDELDPRLIALDDAITAAADAGDLDRVNRLEAHMWLDGPLEPQGRVGGAARERFLEMNGRALALEPETGEAVWPSGPAIWDRLGEVTVPAHVVDGALDVSYVRDRGEPLAARISTATRVVIPGVAHQPMLERPAAVVEQVASLVERVRGGSS